MKPLMFLAATVGAGGALPTFASERTIDIPAATEKMKTFVQSKEIAGAVLIALHQGKVVYHQAIGQADIAGDKPMRTDSIFWIASMTKPVTATAILMLQDEGKLSIADPIGKYIPELANLKGPDGKPANITILQVMTHTSGMGDVPGSQARTAMTLADLVPFTAQQPLHFQPGTKWEYCQSGINTAARIVEVVSGQSFPDFLEQRLFRPLGMKDTTFYLTSEQLPRLAKSYARTSDGRLEDVPNFFLNGKSPTDHDRVPAGNGGLFSTTSDYAAFCGMLLNQGAVRGHRFLTAKAVEQMTSIQTGDIHTGFTEGNGWGVGVCVVRQPQGVTAALSPGSFGHGGAYGTQAWVDPQKGMVYILMVQRANFPNSDASEVRGAFQQAVYDAIKPVDIPVASK